MGIHVGIEHRTHYRFDRAVTIHPHVLRLRPAAHSRTPILAYSLRVEPAEHFLNWQQDPYGNFLARLVFPEPQRELSFTVDLIADLTVINPFDFFVEDSAERYPFVYDLDLARDLEPYLRTEADLGPLLESWLSEVRWPPGGMPIVDFLVSINQRMQYDIAYSVRMEPGVQTPEETLSRGIGSCRDTGWLLVQVLRRLGLAARFVSGYLVQLAADVAALDGPSGPAADFTDLHAWAEVYVPGAGWIGLDATSGLFAGEGHIPLACTPYPSSAAPVTGTTSQATVEFEYSNVVHRIREDPRVTLPYSSDQWQRIDALGHKVDRDLAVGDVRLTMGGEPTFVSIDDMEGAEWNTAADSAVKRSLAGELTGRLATRFAPGGLIQYGQGKWYPGEALPRWQIGITWRRDGQPMWHNRSLLADAFSVGTNVDADGLAVVQRVATSFGIDVDQVVPAYEDPLAVLAHYARLPAGEPPAHDIDQGDALLATEEGRNALVAGFDSPVTKPTGWVLPLFPDANTGQWGTTDWLLRRGRLVLIPGDSPVGLRLPLDSLMWNPAPAVPERSPFETRDQLPLQPGHPAPAITLDRAEAPPTALCVEVRDGNVCVFLPPIERLEDAVQLISMLERIAAELSTPLVIEGYGIPRDQRTSTLVVTPDPGVIEVNIHPTSDWPGLVEVMEGIYQDARQTRLGTEKFALDGLHTGTGGGNHVTIGGATPADSPMLRRPDVLMSMLTYWQRHPALSYLFSGRFIGPTSQAPRIDEARHENLYELEIAFDQLRAAGANVAPWTVDRALRNLLVDLTGNTHRAEFCIDKLFSPDSERGRLGLVELRGFEMPPHPQMALVQALLIRSLVARFWAEPYVEPFIRRGAGLHDQFMLPWFVTRDIEEVVRDLVHHGYAFDRSWLDPFIEFRFPLIGEATVEQVHLELRSAIEPWNVLGEEGGSSGTARYVDSSVERLQVTAKDLDPARYLLTCNLVPVPLSETGDAGVAVAGVRYKAWKPWSSLHPTIDVHTPLVFDVIDRASGRSIGGCTYHAIHPGGRSYDTFPVNANEAEARRNSRFVRGGHTPGAIDPQVVHDIAVINDEYPHTLDLRRFAPR